MKFKVHKNGSAEIFFSEQEIKIISEKKQLVMEPIFFKHFSNLLMNAIINWNRINPNIKVSTEEDTEVETKDGI